MIVKSKQVVLSNSEGKVTFVLKGASNIQISHTSYVGTTVRSSTLKEDVNIIYLKNNVNNLEEVIVTKQHPQKILANLIQNSRKALTVPARLKVYCREFFKMKGIYSYYNDGIMNFQLFDKTKKINSNILVEQNRSIGLIDEDVSADLLGYNLNDIMDPLRHEWISCLLFNALVQRAGNTDEGWLHLLAKGELNEQALKRLVIGNAKKPLENLPPTAQLVGWLILTHHRLPYLADPKQEVGQARENLQRMLKSISATWNYQNKIDDEKRLKACFDFPEGLLSQSAPWLKQLKKWSTKLQQAQPQIQQLIDNGTYRLVLHHARLCLMLGDHYYSSCDADKTWLSDLSLFANTDKNRAPKQKLDEHLVNVSDHAMRISQTLSRFTTDMEAAYDIKNLKQKSPKGYEWQDKAVEKINSFKIQQQGFNDKATSSLVMRAWLFVWSTSELITSLRPPLG